MLIKRNKYLSANSESEETDVASPLLGMFWQGILGTSIAGFTIGKSTLVEAWNKKNIYKFHKLVSFFDC